MYPQQTGFPAMVKEISHLIPDGKIEQRPGWRNQRLSDDIITSYCVIDQFIVYGFSEGFFNLPAVSKMQDLHLKVIREGIPSEQSYIHIINLSGSTGTSLDARAQYLKLILERKHMAALIFVAPNPLYKMTIKLTQKVVKYAFELVIAKNDAEAIQWAYHWLESTSKGKSIYSKLLADRQLKVFKPISTQFRHNHFITIFDLLEPDVIHTEPIGEVREEYLEEMFQARAELLKTISLPEKGFFSIIDMSKIKFDKKVRLSYVRFVSKTYHEFPIRMIIYYKGSRLMHAGYQLSKPFLPCPSRFANTLEEVRQIIREVKAGRPPEPKEAAHPSQEIIDKIMIYLANLDWEKSTGPIKIPDNVDPVYRPVFEVISLLKNDFDKQIDERKLAQEMLQTSLDEKELLLREIHHRIKNNLQLVISMLNMQKRKIEDEQVQQILEASSNRVYSMATIHDILYQSGHIADVNFAMYIETMSMYLRKSYENRERLIRFDFQMEPVMLNISTAIPAGLIVNEILTNSLQYAFPDSFEGSPEIKIVLREDSDSTVELIMQDNGIGVKETPDPDQKEWAGLRMIEMLAKNQLEGEIDMSFESGAQFVVSFKNKSIEMLQSFGNV